MPADVSDAGSGGQVLVDETTFIKIKEDLRPLGAVGPSGINYNKLAERVSLFHLLCLGSLCARCGAGPSCQWTGSFSGMDLAAREGMCRACVGSWLGCSAQPDDGVSLAVLELLEGRGMVFQGHEMGLTIVNTWIGRAYVSYMRLVTSVVEVCMVLA